MEFERFKRIAVEIHKQLHTKADSIVIEGKTCVVNTSLSNCRYVSWQNKVFMQQDPNRDSKYASWVKQGTNVTRIIRSGKKWGYITNHEVYDPMDGQ